MTNTSTKKPVNDLVKFWAEKQDKDKEFEQIPRSPRRPLSPTSSVPPSPLSENFYSKSLFKDIPSNTPPLTPLLNTQNNLHSLISEEGDNNKGRSDLSSQISQQNISQFDSPKDESSTNNNNNNTNKQLVINTDITNITTKDYFTRRPRDYDLNIKDNNKTGPYPPVRKVTDLVSKFEKVASPNNSVQTSPRLTPIKRGQAFVQSTPTSPRNQFTPEPLSFDLPNPSTLSAKTKRRQTVPEPLKISSTSQNQNCESSPVSPISPIENLSSEIPNPQPTSISDSTPEKSSTIKQESLSLKNNVNNQIKKNVSIVLPDNQQEQQEQQEQQQQRQQQERRQRQLQLLQQQMRPISLVRSDCMEFLAETFKDTSFDLSNHLDSANDLKYSSERGFILPETKKPTIERTKENTSAPPFLKSLSEKFIHTKQSNPVSRSKTFPRISNESSKNQNHFEIPDLLPQPEPVSPIRLNFSDFLATPNGSSTNLNSVSPFDDKVNSEKLKKDGEKEKQNNNTIIYKVVVDSKSEASKKNENSKPIRHLSGSMQLFENLKRYLQPNKHKSADDINPSTKKLSQNFNNDNQLNQFY